ncbi:hypothetical protein [Psychroserpens sp.]|uniref:tetratricopeptide repeat protein n=1 Tax=Psychroserpens sp. TaxID=2020870 RepID=UPI002B275E4B|nr:hypothetical protein [Psychroserpens sp.]
MNPNTNISQELLETVDRYINETMSIDELETFENKLKNDSAFKTQVDDIKTLLLGIESQSLKEELENFHNEIPQNLVEKKSAKVRFLQFRKIAVAASLVIALGSFWFFNQNSNDKLFANYFSPDPGLATTMGENSNYEFYDAMVNYKQGDYNTAISKWQQLQSIKPENDTLNYFLGVAHLANSNENKAIIHLEKTTMQAKSAFINEAYYYLGLAYLKTNNLQLAKKNLTFSTIENSKALLSELND